MEFIINAPLHTDMLPLKEMAADQFWEDCQGVALNMYDGSLPPDHWKTSVQSFWSRDAIYIRFKGCYDQLRIAPAEIQPDSLTGKTHQLWDLSDVYEVFTGPEAKKSGIYKEFQVSPDSRRVDIALDASSEERRSDFNWISGMEAISQVDPQQQIWIGLFRIPFSAFNRTPDPDLIWNINFYRIGGEPDQQFFMAWAPVHQIAFHQPHKFGRIHFIH
ncbi:MAG: carbohydrate-binding family 9-like protein [Candidatus Delongbacteria bacterium]|nr:carbohydrate-binding family 9-like protein [Candidatus Delongbacteria bacterium]